MTGGGITLVGGGPGDPGLLTVAGLAALRSADVVLYDHLAPLACLDECPPGVLLIDVGKIPGGRATSQQRINELLIEYGLAGRRVVRFKGGDPFVFGRGGEEVQACTEVGLPVTVIPGVSSAIAGPALAGIPVTHRGVVQAFTVVSGHVPPGHPASTTDWAALARAGHTLVVLMGMANLGAICTELRDRGSAANTPAAVIADAWLPSMRSVRGTIGDIDTLARSAGLRPPAVVVIGELAASQLAVLAPGAAAEVVGGGKPADSASGLPAQAHPTAAAPEPGFTDVLRPAAAQDAAELLVLQRCCWVQEAIDNDTLEIPPLYESVEDVRASIAQWNTWVLRRDGRLIGSARGIQHGTDWELGRSTVAPDLAGHGLGRLLLEHIERQAPPETTRLWLFTGARSHRNQRLCAAAGYRPVPDSDTSLERIPGTVQLAKPAGSG